MPITLCSSTRAAAISDVARERFGQVFVATVDRAPRNGSVGGESRELSFCMLLRRSIWIPGSVGYGRRKPPLSGRKAPTRAPCRRSFQRRDISLPTREITAGEEASRSFFEAHRIRNFDTSTIRISRENAASLSLLTRRRTRTDCFRTSHVLLSRPNVGRRVGPDQALGYPLACTYFGPKPRGTVPSGPRIRTTQALGKGMAPGFEVRWID